jgi:hypothetical protein
MRWVGHVVLIKMKELLALGKAGINFSSFEDEHILFS